MLEMHLKSWVAVHLFFVLVHDTKIGVCAQSGLEIGCMACNTGNENWAEGHKQKACAFGDLGFLGMADIQDDGLATVVLGADRPRVARGAVGGRLRSRVVLVETVDTWWTEAAPVLDAGLMHTIMTHATLSVTGLAGVNATTTITTPWTNLTSATINTATRVREVLAACNASCGGAWTGPVAKVWVSGTGMPRVAATVVESWTWDNPGVTATSTVDDIPWLLDSDASPVLRPAEWTPEEALAWVHSGSGVAELQSVLLVRCTRTNPRVVCGPLKQQPNQRWGLRGSVWASRCVQSSEAASVTTTPPCTCGLDTGNLKDRPLYVDTQTQLQHKREWRPSLGTPITAPCTRTPTEDVDSPVEESAFPGPLHSVVVLVCAGTLGGGAAQTASGPTAALEQMNLSMPTVNAALKGRPESEVPILWVHGMTVPPLALGPRLDTEVAWARTVITSALGRAVSLGWAGQSLPKVVVPSLLGLAWAEGVPHSHVTVVLGVHGACITGRGRVVRSPNTLQEGIPGDTSGALSANTTFGVAWSVALPLVGLAVEAVERGAWNTAVLAGVQEASCTLTPGGFQLESEDAPWKNPPFRVSGVGAVPLNSTTLYLTYPLDITAAVPGVSPPPRGVGWHLLGHHVVLVPVFSPDQNQSLFKARAWTAEVAAMRLRYTTSVRNTTLPWVAHVLTAEDSVNEFAAHLARAVVAQGGTSSVGPRVVSWVPSAWSVVESASVPATLVGAVVLDLWRADPEHTQVETRAFGSVSGAGIVATFGVQGGDGGGIEVKLVRREAVFGVGGLWDALGRLRDGAVYACAPGVSEVVGVVEFPCGDLAGTWVGVPPAGLPPLDMLSPPWYSTGCAYPVEGEDFRGVPGACIPATPENVAFDVDPATVESAVLQAGIRCMEQDLGPLFLPEMQCVWGASSLAHLLLLPSVVVVAVVCTDLAMEVGIVWDHPCVVVCARGLDPATNCTACPPDTMELPSGVCIPCAHAGVALGCLPVGTDQILSGPPCKCGCKEGWTGLHCTGCPLDPTTSEPRVWADGCVRIGEVCGAHGQWVPGPLWPEEDPDDWVCVCSWLWGGKLCTEAPSTPCPPGSSLATGVVVMGDGCQCDDVTRRTNTGACMQCAPPLLAVDLGQEGLLCVDADSCAATGGTPFPDQGWCVFGGWDADTGQACTPGHSLGTACLACPSMCILAGGVCDPTAVYGCRCPWGVAFDPDVGCGRCPLAHVPMQGACFMCAPCVSPWGVCGAMGECICSGFRSTESGCVQCLPGFAAASPADPCVPCEGPGLHCGPMGVCVVGVSGRADTCQCSGSSRDTCVNMSLWVDQGGGVCCANCAPELNTGECHVCTPECPADMVCVNRGGAPACECSPPSVMRVDGGGCVGFWVPADPQTDCEVVFDVPQRALDVCVSVLIGVVCVAPLFLALWVSWLLFAG